MFDTKSYKKGLKRDIKDYQILYHRAKKQHARLVRDFMKASDPELARKFLVELKNHAQLLCVIEETIMELKLELKNL